MAVTPLISRRLRERVVIQRRSSVKDSHGQRVETWTELATVWAAIEPLRGRELFAAQRENAELTTRIRIRYLDGVAPTMRVVYDGKNYDIKSVVNPRETDREMHLMCNEGVNDG